MRFYTYIGFRQDGGSSSIDVMAADDNDRALEQGERFLAEHASCALVEVWCAGHCLGSVSRSALASAGLEGLGSAAAEESA